MNGAPTVAQRAKPRTLGTANPHRQPGAGLPTTPRALARRDPTLAAAGAVSLAASIVCAVLALGDGVWWKPTTFALSIAVYVWTVAWLAAGLRPSRLLRVVRLGTVALLAVEWALIALQAGRGVASHFNGATPFDAAVFSAMGATIGAVTVLAGVLLVLSVRDGRGLPAATRRAVPLGLALFLVGTAVGGAMIVAGGRALAGPAPGLPLVSWDLSAGDLRPAHFVGLHAAQVVPAVGVWADRRTWPLRRGVRLVWMASAVYAAAVAALYGLALTAP